MPPRRGTALPDWQRCANCASCKGKPGLFKLWALVGISSTLLLVSFLAMRHEFTGSLHRAQTNSLAARKLTLPPSAPVSPYPSLLTIPDCPINTQTYSRLYSASGTSLFASLVKTFNSTPRHHPTWLELQTRLFGEDSINVYEDFTSHNGYFEYFKNYPYSHFTSMAFTWLQALLNSEVSFMIEVGSFIGNSAVLIGHELQNQQNYLHNVKPVLLCIDNWLGAGNSWFDTQLRTMMKTYAGTPHIFEQFMQHVIDQNVTDIVIPWRASATVAARALIHMNYIVDAIYLDSAHESGETLFELNLFYTLLKPGGVLMGDDLKSAAVAHDVHLFLQLNHGLQLLISPDRKTWAIVKPKYY